jgi:cytochrome c biogenesis protein CcdA
VTHLPFVAAAYTLGVAVPLAFALAATLRMRAANRRLGAIDPRAARRSRA